MRILVLRLMMMLALLAVSGCSAINTRSTGRYATVVADPHRNEAKAITDAQLAVTLLQEGKCDQAEQALRDALIADVTYGPAHNNLGKLYYEQGKYYLAAWEFEYAAKTMPNRPEPYNNLGMVYEAADRLDQAIQQYSKAHQLAAQNPEFLGNLARALLKKDERSPEVRPLLSELLFYDTRPDWVAWAREELAVGKLPPPALAGPEAIPTPTPQNSLQTQPQASERTKPQTSQQAPLPGESWVTDPPDNTPLRLPALGPDRPNMPR